MRNERPGLSERSEPNGPDSIDALIDEAARRLVSGEPSTTMRGAVRARIDRRRPAWSLIPVFAGAAALLVVFVIVGPMNVGPTQERPTIERTPPTIASQQPEGVATQPARSEASQLSRRRAAVVPPPPVEDDLIPPITIEPLTTAQIAVDESSGATPIEIAPLQIEPLLGQ